MTEPFILTELLPRRPGLVMRSLPSSLKQSSIQREGDITVWINSPGGDVFAASQIYNMLMDYPGKVTVKIDGIAASAASVIAMAADEVLMSPVSMLMIHNPMTVAFGDSDEMCRAALPC